MLAECFRLPDIYCLDLNIHFRALFSFYCTVISFFIKEIQQSSSVCSIALCSPLCVIQWAWLHKQHTPWCFMKATLWKSCTEHKEALCAEMCFPHTAFREQQTTEQSRLTFTLHSLWTDLVGATEWSLYLCPSLDGFVCKCRWKPDLLIPQSGCPCSTESLF